MASAAITCGRRVLAEAVFNTDRTLSARLMPEIERLLALAGIEIAGIDLFAASSGPGSFTGVRGGLATIQGLALATGKPYAPPTPIALHNAFHHRGQLIGGDRIHHPFAVGIDGDAITFGQRRGFAMNRRILAERQVRPVLVE